MLMVISLFSHISLFPLFAVLQTHAGALVQNHASDGWFRACFFPAYSGAISESQPTVRGHTLTRCPLPGWRVAAAP
ncbi:MAG: hypothetical protein FWH34_08800 [Desulfovibrionaceae bacterium]|nr:hypothetical protein [Desulfovibrionaceae bacterium]